IIFSGTYKCTAAAKADPNIRNGKASLKMLRKTVTKVLHHFGKSNTQPLQKCMLRVFARAVDIAIQP
ncbi:MAG TPA: hypothetical protein DCY85_02455, partial [Firmicutes bacterium]|nr:hypothetical protein [Bacillota bacterium]HBE05333.1 hypothetical protein [Bacillota bacterium]